MKFNIIGAGRLGINLALALVKKHELVAVCNSSLASAKSAVKIIGKGAAVASISELDVADVTFICTPDDVIKNVAHSLESCENIKPQSIVVHCSGLLKSSVLANLHLNGCKVASMHPFKSFSARVWHNSAFTNCNCALEGDDDACVILTNLLRDIDALPFSIASDKKALYHAGAVMASNYLVTLADISTSLLVQAGVTQESAKNMISNLMQASLDNIAAHKDIADALTGPIARADLRTVSEHVQSIGSAATTQLYKKLGMQTLAFARLKEQDKIKLTEILT